MSPRRLVLGGATAALLGGVVLTDRAYAYLDPGAGSILLQTIVAGVLGGLYLVKTYWRVLVAFCKRRWRA